MVWAAAPPVTLNTLPLVPTRVAANRQSVYFHRTEGKLRLREGKDRVQGLQQVVAEPFLLEATSL